MAMDRLNDGQKVVVNFVTENRNRNVLILGIGGTGKSTIISAIEAHDSSTAITSGRTAPTGCAGEHIGGTTLHNFLGMGKVGEECSFDEVLGRVLGQPEVVQRIRGLDRLIIDELSMLSSKLLEFVQRVLCSVRKNRAPFGGVQIILLGDFTQLPPVVKRPSGTSDEEYAQLVNEAWCFHSQSWRDLNLKPFILTEVLRTNDSTLQQLVSNASTNSWTPDDTIRLYKRKANTRALINGKDDTVTYLCATRRQADDINDSIVAIKMKSKDPTKSVVNFKGSDHFSHPVNLQQQQELRDACRFPQSVTALRKCRVMILAPGKVRAYNPGTKETKDIDIVNGTVVNVFEYGREEFFMNQEKLGILGSFGNNKEPQRKIPMALMVELKSGFRFLVGVMEESVTIGGITLTRFQFPVTLCYAITIHKSQAKTFDRIHIVMTGNENFATGLFYVALSRATSLDGVTVDEGFDISKVRLGPHDDVKALYARLFPNENFSWTTEKSCTSIEQRRPLSSLGKRPCCSME